ncbi:hypothetical protein AVEN_158162-1 [Araneus ventricosus]|uniref:Uncharacterized protein n=1 Tax=Araneus ventricosus TaxID=182803 RepID=A0A4Y2U2I6_ARAVE|nr:hypothetical protein AVEN_158162-1 [Araneus ventricosus]
MPLSRPIHQFELIWRTSIIDAFVKCELSSFIRFPQAQGNTGAEIHRRMSRVYGENCYAKMVSPGKHHDFLDEKPPIKQAGSRFSWGYSNGVGLSNLYADDRTYLLPEGLGVVVGDRQHSELSSDCCHDVSYSMSLSDKVGRG